MRCGHARGIVIGVDVHVGRTIFYTRWCNNGINDGDRSNGCYRSQNIYHITLSVDARTVGVLT